MGNRRFRAGVLASAILAGCAIGSQAMAQAGSSDTGCDGTDQKAVVVPCAGIEFCTCADHCSANSDCLSDCCQNEVCLPKCACEGSGYSECKLGEYPSDARESESGGCSVGSVTTARGAGWLGTVLIAGLVIRALRGGAKGGQRRARS